MMNFCKLSVVHTMLLGLTFSVLLCIGCSRSDKSGQLEPKPAAVQDEQPYVSGDWVGTWGIAGRSKDLQQRLDCHVVAVAADRWEATFEGECGRPYKYTIQMLGRRSGNVVLFKGSADLGEKDGGVYDWIGRATEEKFVGFYTSQRYTGTFEMGRPESLGAVSENPN